MTEQPPPVQSRLADWYRDADLVDTFAAPLPSGADNNLRAIGDAVFGQPLPGLKTLFSIRDGVTRRLGIKVADKPRSLRYDDDDDHVGIFPVLSVHDDELILGKDDRLMNLRISLFVQKGGDGLDRVLATTVVQCHNRRARAYIALIKPFHRLLIRLSLYRAANAGFANGTIT
ncbi:MULTISPECIES: DUF2867 domain-containing protein [unclassified Rhizobium]|uniref:DUF2867 domain-containing protein n=1 Tax=unclassified Rhizobium TaxID=2613769 RepID=UPI0027D42E8E|nr:MULTISPECIES: DUF2867 domain-containing protein [unclassified Rhizobium]MDQ4408726.1 DUF2867 domain-containing protein [Rhizobium sp. AN63]